MCKGICGYKNFALSFSMSSAVGRIRRLGTSHFREGSLVMAAVRDVNEEELTLNLPYNVLASLHKSHPTHGRETSRCPMSIYHMSIIYISYKMYIICILHLWVYMNDVMIDKFVYGVAIFRDPLRYVQRSEAAEGDLAELYSPGQLVVAVILTALEVQ